MCLHVCLCFVIFVFLFNSLRNIVFMALCFAVADRCKEMSEFTDELLGVGQSWSHKLRFNELLNYLK